MATVSGFYTTEVVGKLRVPGQVLKWNIDGISPSGYRQHESGVYKPYSKIGPCGGFDAQQYSGGVLDFGQVYIDQDNGFYTDTVCLTFNLGDVNNNPSSYFYNIRDSMGSDFKAFNLKVWLNTYTAFSGLSPIFYYLNSAEWRRSFKLRSTTPGVLPLPSSLPTNRNWTTSSANEVFISGCYKEAEFSKYMYIVGKFPSGTYNLGTYGGLGQGTFIFKVSYDWSDIDANILDSDL